VAAIIAAGLAAYVSIRNHKQQLAHDRDVRYRDATRESIDNAVRGMSDFILQGVTFSGYINALELARSALEEIDSSELAARAEQQADVETNNAKIQEIVPLLSAATNTIHADTIHLAIRVGKKHSLTTTQERVREALKTWLLALDKGSDRNRTEKELVEANNRRTDFRNARAAFEAACFAWMRNSA
jgi:hypothetical protein